MQVNSGVSELGVAEKHLDGAQIGARFEHVRCEAVPQGILVLLMICIPQKSVIPVTPSTELRWKLFAICEGWIPKFSSSDFPQEHRSHYPSGC